MNTLESPDNSNLYAIVSVGYNRLKSQKRLLSSLLKADYSNFGNVPLVISIDCSGDQELYQYVNDFKWPYGDKYVLIREKRLGLKEHILSCGDLTKFFKGIILLEDDIYVAKGFYKYTVQMNDFYGEDNNIASISLYSNEMNGFSWVPLYLMHGEADVFASQSVATWGEFWNSRMWSEFREWLQTTDIQWDKLDMSPIIKGWTKAWSKFFDAYMVSENKFSIYPYVSLTTNFSDAGEHGGANNTIVQVSLQQGIKELKTLPFEQLVKYDVYCNNLFLYDTLCLDKNELCLDLYGERDNDFNKRYYLTVKRLPYKVVKSYGLFLRPPEINIIEDIPGKDIYLYDTTIKATKPKGALFDNRILYYLHGFNYKYLLLAFWGNIKILSKKAYKRINKKLGIK